MTGLADLGAERAEGNPFFAEEIVRDLIDRRRVGRPPWLLSVHRREAKHRLPSASPVKEHYALNIVTVLELYLAQDAAGHDIGGAIERVRAGLDELFRSLARQDRHRGVVPADPRHRPAAAGS